MFSDVKSHVLYTVGNAVVQRYPFSHIVVDGVFPAEFYSELTANLPDESTYTPLVDTGRVGQGYSRSRMIWMPADDTFEALPTQQAEPLKTAFRSLFDQEFARVVLDLFEADIKARLSSESSEDSTKMSIRLEGFLIKDKANYSLGPHTDSPRKLVSGLLYLPQQSDHPELGTSIYLPKDRGFTCPGGPHHTFDKFEHLATIPYLPNRIVAFPKTDKAFHGVELVEGDDLVRDIMFFDINRE